MKKPILITGSHRSGSTWTGKVIATSNKVRYVKEPFNVGIKHYNPPFSCWFKCLKDAPAKEQKAAEHYLNSFYSVYNTRYYIKSLKMSFFRNFYHFMADFRSRIIRRSLIKDPIAVMSAEWIYQHFGWDIVVLIRHPAAFVASLKTKEWYFDFNNFLLQPNLMQGYLKPYYDEITLHSNVKKDIIDQGILLWNTIHHTIVYYREQYEHDWYFVRHEDLSLNPLFEFQKLFEFLRLPFNRKVQEHILLTTTSDQITGLERNSIKNIKTWKGRLTADEIERIKDGTKGLWPKFYIEDDWI